MPGDVAVERHLGEAEVAGDALHGDRVDAVGVGDRDRGVDDRGHRQRHARLLLRLVAEIPERVHFTVPLVNPASMCLAYIKCPVDT
ncbi:hypothetical protein [Actinomadura madurae]|uniref:hypothetical protein n=1 Tax=Actinomadura madurae TaxID=1993 RepID=UPI0020D1F801|nr:hypothetical protein [Actinomadura madurae]MCP9980367.1 hypothetical protein [Actinomadura madurae]